jgi:endonuclease YncB( thermonuclease family)
MGSIQNPYDHNRYKVKINYVHDGDTITDYEIDLGFGIGFRRRRGEKDSIRLANLNAPELWEDGGKKSRAFLKQLEGREVWVRSFKVPLRSRDHYGRYVFEIYAPGELFGLKVKEVNVGSRMISMGLAKYETYE